MKVVINKCYGGFSLSHEAMLKYFEYKGIPCYPEKDSCGYTYWTVPEEKRKGILSHEEWLKASVQQRVASNKIQEQLTIYDWQIDRNDEALVKVVEELGESANGECAKLKIIWATDPEWEIAEYDGNEWIAEKHRTWGLIVKTKTVYAIWCSNKEYFDSDTKGNLCYRGREIFVTPDINEALIHKYYLEGTAVDYGDLESTFQIVSFEVVDNC